jgi:hypothetical protein
MGWPGGGRRGRSTTRARSSRTWPRRWRWGGDCLADIAVLREQPDLAGPVASDPVVSRLVAAVAADLPRFLKAVRSARAAARERAWALAGNAAPGADASLVTIDLDATIVIAHSEKEQAAPTWKNSLNNQCELQGSGIAAGQQAFVNARGRLGLCTKSGSEER